MAERSGRTRIADVARGAGVSKTTVSFAFNSPDRVKPETARRIREVARALGYEPHPGRTDARAASDPHDRPADAAGPCRDVREPVLRHVQRGRRRVAEARGLRPASSSRRCTARSRGRSDARPWTASSRSGCRATIPEIEQIRQAGLPTVLVDSTPFESQGVVDIDDEAGRVRGRPTISRTRPSRCPRDRRRAAASRRRASIPTASWAAGCAAIAERSAGPASSCPTTPSSSAPRRSKAAPSAFRRAWQAGLRPTGVLAMSDSIAIGVIRAARDLRIPVPGDAQRRGL